MAVNFIKKIWQNEPDKEVHAQFVRFSKGNFENRAVISVRKGSSVKLGCTFEFAAAFALFVSQLTDARFSGIIIAKENFDEIFARNNSKPEITKKKGMFVYNIINLPSRVISEIGGKAYSMLLDAEASGISMKTKKKLPKPGKSGKEKVDDKFCILELDLKFFRQLHDEFLFDIPSEFKKARIAHAFIISEIILPKGEKDFELIRLNAKRKGKIVRTVEVDGKLMKQEKPFEA